MIQSKKDYIAYLKADEEAQRIEKRSFMINYLFPNEIIKFTKLLRKVEYFKNCKKGLFYRLIYYYYLRRLRQRQIKTGFMIEPNCFAEGLSISHIGPIIVNPYTKVGRNCRIHVGVNIGTKAGYSDKAPKIGNNVYIGPGAKIFDAITIADGVAIGANSVVNKNFEEPNITIAGVPAKKISAKGSAGLLVVSSTLS